MDKEIGKVSHYYDKAGVAIVVLTAPIAVGDTLKFKRGEAEFEQTVGSMQIEHAPVQKAKKGDSVGIKVDQPVKTGTKVYQVK